MSELTDEQLRILKAASEGRLRTDYLCLRWLIEGEPRPIYCERLRLLQLGLLQAVRHVEGFHVGRLTDAGREALEAR